MPIPDVEESGFLPEGVHFCTLAEVEERFSYFGRSGRRMALFASLLAYAEEARQTGMARALVLDESFVSAKEEPNDIDLVVVLEQDILTMPLIAPSFYNAISRKQIAKRYGLDVLVAREGGREYQNDVEFFGRSKEPTGLPKGLLRVEL